MSLTLRARSRRPPLWVTLAGMIAVVLVALVVAFDIPESQSAAHPERVVSLAMEDIVFRPVEIEVKDGSLVRVEFENAGTLRHAFTIDDLPVDDLGYTVDGIPTTAEELEEQAGHVVNSALHLPLDAGAAGSIEFRAAEPGEYDFYCAEPGHRAAGMVGMLRVVTPADEETAPDSPSPSDASGDHPQSDDASEHAPSDGAVEHVPSDEAGDHGASQSGQDH